jgi:hypothetical protein
MPDRSPTAVHVSWLKRDDGELGGVEKFAAYLRIALQERGWAVAVIGWRDFPQAAKFEQVSNPDKALILGRWLDGPTFGMAYDVAVSDGYWGLGITSHPVVPVVHGTWAEFHVRMGLRPTLEVQRQGEAFNAPNAFPIACSHAAAREVRRHHGRTVTATILHGIDLAAYHAPAVDEYPPDPPPWVVLHAASNEKKGSRLIAPIQHLLGPDYDLQYLNAGLGQEPAAFRRGHMFLHPTRHEGNAYANLEALATNLPTVTTKAGIFEDVPADPTGQTAVGFTLPVGATPEHYAAAIRQTCRLLQRDYWGRRPRLWAEANANMTDFADAWDTALRQIIGAKRG